MSEFAEAMSTIRPDFTLHETATRLEENPPQKEMTVERVSGLVADIGGNRRRDRFRAARSQTTRTLWPTQRGRTVYDCMYVALAARLNTRRSSADDHLEAALRKFPGRSRVTSNYFQTLEPRADDRDEFGKLR